MIHKGVLLATALVVNSHNNHDYTVRALIDPGSEVSLILESVQRRIGLTTSAISASISGMGDQETASTNKVAHITLRHRNQKTINLEALLLKKLTADLPSQKLDMVNLSQFSDLQLADHSFYKSRKIEMVFGADIYPIILTNGIKKYNNGRLIAQATIFGWILSGECPTQTISSNFVSYYTELNLEDRIKKFWEVEEISVPSIVSDEERYCEEIYQKTTVRNTDGRYVVNLPFVEAYPREVSLGNSHSIALSNNNFEKF